MRREYAFAVRRRYSLLLLTRFLYRRLKSMFIYRVVPCELVVALVQPARSAVGHAFDFCQWRTRRSEV